MEYLTTEDLYELNVVDFEGEKLLLLKADGEEMTFIDEVNDKNDGEYIDLQAKVFVKQRWKVDVLPPDSFSKTFTTHRAITVYYGKYRDLLKQQQRIYTAHEVNFSSPVDTNTLGDDFNNIF